MATLAPEATKRSVIARPNPCAPPVTTAQRPFRSILFMVRFLFFSLLLALHRQKCAPSPRTSRGEGGGEGLFGPEIPRVNSARCLAPHPETSLRIVSDLSPRR